MHPVALLFAALAIGSQLVSAQTCDTGNLDSCISAISNICTDDPCRCTAFMSETACYTSYCAVSTPTALAIALSEVCVGTTAPNGCGDFNSAIVSCFANYGSMYCTDTPCSCSGQVGVFNCYTLACPGYTIPSDLVEVYTSQCSSGMSTAATRTVPTAPATISAGPGITGTAGQGTCNIQTLSSCYIQHTYTCSSDNACACEGLIVQSNCYTSYCAGSVPTDVVEDVRLFCTGQANPGSTKSGGLSQPAKIGVGVGAGVGGALAVTGVLLLLFKAGYFSGAGGAAAAKMGNAGAGGSTAAGGWGANAAPPGDMTTASKLGWHGFTPGGEAANLTSPSPGHAATGGEAGAGVNGYGPTGSEFTSQGPITGFEGPTVAEAGNVIAPGNQGFLTGTEGAHISGPADLEIGPTDNESANFTAPGTNLGPTGTEGPTFSAPGPTDTEGTTFSAHGPTGTEGPAFSTPLDPNMGHTGINGVIMGSQPPGASPPSAAYFAIPAAVAPIVAGAALLSRRKPVGSPPSLPPTATGQTTATAAGQTTANAAGQTAATAAGQTTWTAAGQPSADAKPSEDLPANVQHELEGDNVQRRSELETYEVSFMLQQEWEEGLTHR